MESVRAERIGIGAGFASCLYRLYPTYGTPEHGPPTLILKLPSDNPDIQRVQSSDIAFREVRFYRDVAHAFECPVPHIHFSDYEPVRGSSSIVMEDLPGITSGFEASVAESEAAMRALARLHARFWQHPILQEPWLQSLTNADVDLVWLIDNAIASAERTGFGDAHLTRAIRMLRPVVPLVQSLPPQRNHAFSLCHGDMHRNNSHLQQDGRLVMFDWQALECGNPLRDVSYWMLTSLTVEQRREQRKGLLRTYHEALVAEGIGGYSQFAMMQDFRVGLSENLIKIYAALALTDADDELRTMWLERIEAASRDTHLIAVAYFMKRVVRLRSWWQKQVS